MSDSTVRNLLRGTGETVDSDGYGVVSYELAEPLVVGREYTVSAYVEELVRTPLPSGVDRPALALYDGAGWWWGGNLSGDVPGVQTLTFTYKQPFPGHADPDQICLYNTPQDDTGVTRRARFRDVMLVEGDAPAAWAPAEGETLAGGGALMSANILDDATVTRGTKDGDGYWVLSKNDGTDKKDSPMWRIDGQPILAENQAFHVACSVMPDEDWGSHAARMYVEYKDAAGHFNWVSSYLGAARAGAWTRLEAELAVPSGMRVTWFLLSNAYTWASGAKVANPVFSYGSAVTLASAEHVATRTEWLRKGLYVVDQPDSYGGTIQLSCLDMLTRLEVPFSGLGISQFPYKASELLSKVFEACGVLIRTGSFSPVYDPELSRVPNGANVSALQVASYIAQLMGGWIRCDANGDAFVSWYDSSAIEAESWFDGGTLSGDATPYEDGVALDGGTFSDYSSGASADGGTFATNKTVSHVYDPKDVTVSTDDVVITGVEVTAQNEVVVGEDGKEANGRDGETYLAGKSGYVLRVASNPLVEYGTAKALAEALYGRVGGMRFRAFDATAPSDPSIEAGDPIVIADYTGAMHTSYVTGLKLVVDGSETLRCSAETPSRNGAAGASATTQAIVAARNEARRASTEVQLVRESVERKIAEKSGLYHSEERLSDGSTVYYLHDKPTVGASQVVWKMNSSVMSVSTDGGRTWNSSLTADGDALLERIYAKGINADYINTGTLDIRDANGNVTARLSNGTPTGLSAWDPYTNSLKPLTWECFRPFFSYSVGDSKEAFGDFGYDFAYYLECPTRSNGDAGNINKTYNRTTGTGKFPFVFGSSGFSRVSLYGKMLVDARTYAWPGNGSAGEANARVRVSLNMYCFSISNTGMLEEQFNSVSTGFRTSGVEGGSQFASVGSFDDNNKITRTGKVADCIVKGSPGMNSTLTIFSLLQLSFHVDATTNTSMDTRLAANNEFNRKEVVAGSPDEYSCAVAAYLKPEYVIIEPI